jgi:hypothetical protein
VVAQGNCRAGELVKIEVLAYRTFARTALMHLVVEMKVCIPLGKLCQEWAVDNVALAAGRTRMQHAGAASTLVAGESRNSGLRPPAKSGMGSQVLLLPLRLGDKRDRDPADAVPRPPGIDSFVQRDFEGLCC